MTKVKMFKIVALTLMVGTALQAFSGSVSADEPRGRSASAGALSQVTIKFTDLLVSGHEVPMDQISLNFAKSINPEQPGVRPGGGNIEP